MQEQVSSQIGTSLRQPRIHSFSKQVLDYYGNKIYVRGKQILKLNHKGHYELVPIKPQIIIGQSFLDEPEEENYSHISYETMQRTLKLTIAKRRAKTDAWRGRQRVIHYIIRRKAGVKEIPLKAASSLTIEHDPYNKRARLVGETAGTSDGQYGLGGVGPWVYYDQPFNRTMNMRIYDTAKAAADSITDRWLGKEQSDKKKTIPIPEMPIMITNDNYLLCLPKTRDLQNILIVGKKRFGKTWVLNRMCGGIYHLFGDCVGVLNDSLDQFHSMMLPNPDISFMRDLSRIGEQPSPLPTINLYLSAPNINMRYANEGVDFRLVLSFMEFLAKYKFYTFGVRKWDLGGSERYLNENRKYIYKCVNEDDIKEILFARFSERVDLEKDKGFKAMIMKMRDTFGSIFNEQFTDNLFQDDETTSPTWKLDKAVFKCANCGHPVRKDMNGFATHYYYNKGFGRPPVVSSKCFFENCGCSRPEISRETLEGHPFIIAMEAGLVPIINTVTAKRCNYFRNYMADLMEKIPEWQMRRGVNKNRMWIMIDEQQDIYETGRKKDNAALAYENLIRQGGQNWIGTVGNTQDYQRIHQDIKKNTSHLLCTLIEDAGERRDIQKTYNLTKDQADMLGELNKFEFVAISNEPWVIYDCYGRRKLISRRTFRGKVLPPYNMHLKPGAK